MTNGRFGWFLVLNVASTVCLILFMLNTIHDARNNIIDSLWDGLRNRRGYSTLRPLDSSLQIADLSECCAFLSCLSWAAR